MNFSDYFAQTSNLVRYQAGGGDLIAIAKNFDVQILDTNTLRVINRYQFLDLVSHLEWSPDGEFILIGVEKRGQAFVKNIRDNEWQCKIDEGLAGLANCMWAPTSRHVMTV